MHSQNRTVTFSFGGGLTPVVRTLIIINISAYLMMGLSSIDPHEIYALLGLRPAMVTGQLAIWQLVTYMFLHSANFLHILFNMLMLWWFGADIERVWGSKLFLRYFFLTGIGAGITTILVNWGGMAPTIGASGAVYGLLLAFGIMYPNREILLFFVLPIKAKYLVLLCGLLELLSSARASSDGVAHFAHLGGMLFGLLWFGYYSRLLSIDKVKRSLRKRRSKRHLKVVREDQEADDDSAEGSGGPTIH